ncbi:hypothetical protein [Microbacterium sp. ZW T5_56]|uniref:hypothetical protein n=1 Tax=Microbacterium sp. ZW T5_56 TaxID=3378081 RepID=UPI003853A6CC
MTTTDNSGEQLTRRQLRELRLTGQTPVVGDGSAFDDSASADPVPPRRDAPVSNPLPRPAEPIIVAAPELPAQSPADGTEHRLTRRELRDLERVRTASVPVIRPADADADADADAETAPQADDIAPAVETHVPAAEEPVATIDAPQEPATAEADGGSMDHAEPSDAPAEGESSAAEESQAEGESQADNREPEAADAATSDVDVVSADSPASDSANSDTTAGADQGEPAAAAEEEPRPAWAPPAASVTATPAFDAPAKLKTPEKSPAEKAAASESPTLSSAFGAQVAAGVTSGEQSFDDLISRDSGGSTAAGHSLVLSDSALPPLTAPVTSTGAMLVTGTFNLPELGSQGHAPGVADGKDVDAVLIDGELPAASSPTPIAATAAVSQAKAPGEIIKPPVPEKSNKLMLILAITAGVLALALVGVIVGAALTGMMQ